MTLSFALEPVDGSFFGVVSSSSSGVFTPGETGNARARINTGEAVTFTVTSTRALELASLDLNLVGGATDAAFVSINGGADIQLYAGAPLVDFNGTTDVFTANLPIASGSTIRISTNNEIGLQGITFNVAAIPEPSSWALIGMIGLSTAIYRRRQSRTKDHV
ncbi:MAG: PEP-CTERM sorting domain-containing protein [Fuerstiella sp.]